MKLRVQLFGALEANNTNGSKLSFRNTPTSHLLAYLAYHYATSHSRQRMADFLWPDPDNDRQGSNLNNSIYNLRKKIAGEDETAPQIFISNSKLIGLNLQYVTVDVLDFKALAKAADKETDASQKLHLLQRAISLYKGDLLPTFEERW